MKSHFALLLTACLSTAALAQTTAPVQARDPNPPYGAAAATANRQLPAAAASTGSTTAGTRAAVQAPTAGAAVSNAATSAGASSTGTTQAGGLAPLPGQAIPSRGSTTGTPAASAAPYDPRSAPGWSMMTPQEQQRFSGRVSSFTSLAECRAYHDAYMAQIQARARTMGQIVASHGPDPCASLQPQAATRR
jgi:hypothetical protein